MWIKPTLYIVWSRNTKINKPASAALKQIDDQGYMIPYSADGRKLYKIGVSFSTKTRTVEDWDYNIG
uniref:PD-(D/E)XK nuclease domain-containing protein n=1 Tax=Prevotella sp. TaxID=59823 RepID=UPI004026D9BE